MVTTVKYSEVVNVLLENPAISRHPLKNCFHKNVIVFWRRSTLLTCGHFLRAVKQSTTATEMSMLLTLIPSAILYSPMAHLWQWYIDLINSQFIWMRSPLSGSLGDQVPSSLLWRIQWCYLLVNISNSIVDFHFT